MPQGGLVIFLDSRSPIGVEDKLRGNDEKGSVTFYNTRDVCQNICERLSENQSTIINHQSTIQGLSGLDTGWSFLV
jgi:hypothetical protein